MDLSSAGAAGALAVGACGAYGYAFDFSMLVEARAAALANCTNKRCRLVLVMQHACGAFAIDGHDACGAHGYAEAPRLGQAQNIALQYCYKYGGRDCVIRAFACDRKG
ncbi:MAG: DUF4189 domain-containing protein [Bradyrhizobiaceae bacterium]|nr:DUF4189 domain-containing protein [Bradyrhizobiaceae bacterium]